MIRIFEPQHKNYKDWLEDCIKYRGELLKGKLSHWCYDWDGLPIDETCFEYTEGTCTCWSDEEKKEVGYLSD